MSKTRTSLPVHTAPATYCIGSGIGAIVRQVSAAGSSAAPVAVGTASVAVESSADAAWIPPTTIIS